MINGYVITYKPLDLNSKVNFHHALFGRLLVRQYRNIKKTVYIKGILHDFPFKRLEDSKIFVTSISNINIDDLRTLARIEIEETEMYYDDLKTGEQYWKDIATYKKIEIYYGKQKKHNESSGIRTTNKSSRSNEGTRIFS